MGCYDYYNIDDIPYGGYIAENIYDKNGTLLVKSGTLIDNNIAEKLKHYSKKLRVYSNNKRTDTINKYTDKINEDNKEKSLSTFVLSDDIKNRAKQGVEYIYNNPNSDEVVGVADEISEEIIGAINSTDGICIDITELKICDDYTFQHSVDVATMAVLMAKSMNMTDKYKKDIGLAGILHDIGKTKIPDEILNAPRKLTDEEFDLIKKHPIYGYELIKNNKDMSDEAKVGVLTHHEKYDGTGYPLGIKGPQINIIGKILSTVDVYDALVTKRPYRKEIIEPSTVIEMMLGMTNQFDIEILKEFLQCVILYPIGTMVVLSDNKIYKVVKQNIGYPLRPVVFDVLDKINIDLLDMQYFNLVITKKL